MLAPGLDRNHSGRLIGFAGECVALALPIGALADPQQDSEQTVALSQTTLNVNEENKAANLSIKWLVSNHGGGP